MVKRERADLSSKNPLNIEKDEGNGRFSKVKRQGLGKEVSGSTKERATHKRQKGPE